MAMNKVSAEVDYANGLLRLDRLSGELPAPAGKAGTFTRQRPRQVLPRGDADVRSGGARPARGPARAPARRDWRARWPAPCPVSVRGGASLDRLQDPTTWRGTASVRIPRLEVYGLTFTDVSAAATVLRGLAALSDVTGELHGGPLTGGLTLSLTGAQRFQGDLRVRGLDVGRLATAPAAWSGSPRAARGASAELHGTLQPLPSAAQGSCAGAVRFAGVPLDKLSLDLDARRREAEGERIHGRARQGQGRPARRTSRWPPG